MTFIQAANFRSLPPVWELAQPFRVDATGVIAFDQDPVAWAKNHILSVVLTSPGERVMRPGYGVGMYYMVFENDNPVLEQQITTAVQMAVTAWEPNITIQECKFTPQMDFSGIVELMISFSVGASPTVHSVRFSLGGTGVEVKG